MDGNGIVRDNQLERHLGEKIWFGHPLAKGSFIGELRRHVLRGKAGYCVFNPENEEEYRILEGQLIKLPSDIPRQGRVQSYRSG